MNGQQTVILRLQDNMQAVSWSSLGCITASELSAVGKLTAGVLVCYVSGVSAEAVWPQSGLDYFHTFPVKEEEVLKLQECVKSLTLWLSLSRQSDLICTSSDPITSGHFAVSWLTAGKVNWSVLMEEAQVWREDGVKEMSGSSVSYVKQPVVVKWWAHTMLQLPGLARKNWQFSWFLYTGLWPGGSLCCWQPWALLGHLPVTWLSLPTWRRGGKGYRVTQPLTNTAFEWGSCYTFQPSSAAFHSLTQCGQRWGDGTAVAGVDGWRVVITQKWK